MKVDIQDVLFWMDAVRNSSNRYRTLESFWKGQVHSKLWLIENLEEYFHDLPRDIVIHGGWNGVLASLLFNSKVNVAHVTSVDIDPTCEEVAYTVNKRYEMQGKFTAVTSDMCDYVYKSSPHIVINTSCEHVSQEAYQTWLDKVPSDSLVVVQSNNYYNLDEHVNCKSSLTEFIDSSNLNVMFSGQLELPKYTRYMIIGKKHG